MTSTAGPGGGRSPAVGGGTGAAIGACYGFEVRSTLPLRCLRERGDRPLDILEVSEEAVQIPQDALPIQTWEASPDRRPRTSLYRQGKRYTVGTGEGYRFRVDPARGRIGLAGPPDPFRRETLLWMTPASVAVVWRGDLALHAASVEIEGVGVLIAAPSARGKTSTAAALGAAGCRVLSDDFACCRPGPEPEVLPGPALLRLRPDAADRLELRDVEVVARAPNRLYLTPDPPLRGTGDPVPLGGIFFLEETPGPIELVSVTSDDAVRNLWAMSFFLPEDAARARCFRGLGELARRLPVWRLKRAQRWETLPQVLERIVETARPT